MPEVLSPSIYGIYMNWRKVTNIRFYGNPPVDLILCRIDFILQKMKTYWHFISCFQCEMAHVFEVFPLIVQRPVHSA